MLEACWGRRMIVACLADKSPLQWRFGRHRRTALRITSLVETVMRQMEPSILASPAFLRYPWCFLAPDSTKGARYFFVGAFLPSQITTDVLPEMLYVRVSERWLLDHLQEHVGLPLWLSRALVPLINRPSWNQQSEEVRQACRFLQRLLASERGVWGRCVLPTQAQQLENLYAMRCEADEELLGEHGVDAMPWMNWPGCIQHNESIWLWRQSRHGKVIESQKVIIEKIHD
ncbi:hypothetical protein [Serratia inhibens]|uniref:hypothetical protein n=1 Tax=Serratia inhibens TaxID=2338073 RepID=UPI00025E367F|nr:hypothetical protein [Serratia inhibens]ANS44523.1 hypothetical protein Q5A_020500 [Serratia inhibens PRI-2C]